MKHYLLDTHVALWVMLDDARLKSEKLRTLFQEEVLWVFHQVSIWEIQIKYQLGKLKLPERPEAFLLTAVEQSGFQYERIEDKAIFLLDRLPELHRDPFDRMLVSHAIANGWTLVTADSLVSQYPVPSIEV